MVKIIASITTIPSRNKLLKKCINSLLKQTYPVDKIILTIPKFCLRGNIKCKIPLFLKKPKYKDKIILVNPDKDYGPVMKYIGGVKYICNKDIVFICDDDQEYKPYIIENLMKRYNKLSEYDKQNSVVVTRHLYWVLEPLVLGYASMLMKGNIIKLINDNVKNSSKKILSACQLVDDNWVSFILRKNNIHIESLNYKDSDLFIGDLPNEPQDGLCKTTFRQYEICKCMNKLQSKTFLFYIILIITLLILVIFSGYKAYICY